MTSEYKNSKYKNSKHVFVDREEIRNRFNRTVTVHVLELEVLRLNKSWQVIGTCKVRKALEDLAAGSSTALLFDQGSPTPYRWNDWINLLPREGMDLVHTPHRSILVPRVVIMVNFNKLIVRPPKLTMKNLRARDQDTCQYTGKKLKPSEMSKEHVKAASHGGKTEWDNIVLAHREVNSKRGNQPLEKVGLKLLRRPVAPRGKKPSELITPTHPEWEMFLKN